MMAGVEDGHAAQPEGDGGLPGSGARTGDGLVTAAEALPGDGPCRPEGLVGPAENLPDRLAAARHRAGRHPVAARPSAGWARPTSPLSLSWPWSSACS